MIGKPRIGSELFAVDRDVLKELVKPIAQSVYFRFHRNSSLENMGQSNYLSFVSKSITSLHDTPPDFTTHDYTSQQETATLLTQLAALCKIKSLAPLCQSRNHGTPGLEGESNDAYDLRTWPNKLHTHVWGKSLTVAIPARAIHDALAEAAKYSKRQIPGQGKATWTQKFASGIALLEDINLGIDPKTVDFVPVYCHADGNPRSGKRVLRRFPIIPEWSAEFEVKILDPIITKDVFVDMLEQAGMFIGVGQNRPQNRGTHGRFGVVNVEYVGEVLPDQRKIRAA